MVKVAQVNKNDQFLGFINRKKAHQGKGILHRALCVFIFNNRRELLLQKRSKYKKLWPLYWSNTCCSHPLSKDQIMKEAQKRLMEEMGFSTKINFVLKTIYRFTYKNIGSEYELAYVFLGKYQGKIKPNIKEVADYKWVKIDWLINNIRLCPEIYSPWFLLEFRTIQEKGIC